MGRGHKIDLALAFARADFPVFPVNVYRQAQRWAKVPHVVKWADVATTDASVIAEWWLRWPLAMPGLPLKRCDCVVVDCDRHPGAANGVAAFRALGPLPRHPVVTTKSGGEHHWFREPAQRITKHDWCDGIEVLGTSAFVVGYTLPQGAIPDLPEMFWRTRDGKHREEHREEENTTLLPIIARHPHPYRTQFRTHNVQVRSKRILREIERAKRNDNRNKCLHWGAARLGNMIAEGVIAQEVAEKLLVGAAKTNGLWREDGEAQCLATIRGGIRAGIEEWQSVMRHENREHVCVSPFIPMRRRKL